MESGANYKPTKKNNIVTKVIIICIIVILLTITFISVYFISEKKKAMKISNATQKAESLIDDIYSIEEFDAERANALLRKSKALIDKHSLKGRIVEDYYNAKNYVENYVFPEEDAKVKIVKMANEEQLPGSGFDIVGVPYKVAENDENYLFNVVFTEIDGPGASYVYKVNKKSGAVTFIGGTVEGWEVLEGCEEFL